MVMNYCYSFQNVVVFLVRWTFTTGVRGARYDTTGPLRYVFLDFAKAKHKVGI